MDYMQMVKAAKSALSDFGTFWTELYKVFTKTPGVFERFGKWDTDRISKANDKDYVSIVDNTRDALNLKASK